MSDIVNAVLLKNGGVLLAKRSAARPNYPNRWSFPGGHVEAGESLEQALAREMDEEIGVRPLDVRKLAVIADPADTRVAYHMYAVTRWSGGAPRLIGDEHVELRWLDLEAAASLDGLALPEYRALFDRLRPSPGKI